MQERLPCRGSGQSAFGAVGWKADFWLSITPTKSGLSGPDDIAAVANDRCNDKTDAMSTLYVTEIPFENGNIRYRYSRKMSPDGAKWIRDGLFQAYYENGNLASEGHYTDGVEHGRWRDYHENGQLAAEGTYISGVEADDWCHWSSDGRLSDQG